MQPLFAHVFGRLTKFPSGWGGGSGPQKMFSFPSMTEGVREVSLEIVQNSDLQCVKYTVHFILHMLPVHIIIYTKQTY